MSGFDPNICGIDIGDANGDHTVAVITYGDSSYLAFEIVGGNSAALSARLVCEVLTASSSPLHALAECFPDFLDAESLGPCVELRLEAGDLFSAEPVSLSALRTAELILKPSDRYLEFVAAIARGVDVPLDFDLHGWPILSSVCGIATIADLEAAHIPAASPDWVEVSGLGSPADAGKLFPLLSKLHASDDSRLVVDNCGINSCGMIREDALGLPGSVSNEFSNVIGVGSSPLDEANEVDRLVGVTECKTTCGDVVQVDTPSSVCGNATIAGRGEVASLAPEGRSR